MRNYIGLGAVNAFLAVAIGAFGAHGLKDKLSDKMLEVFHTGDQYHMIHALGLILLAVAADKVGPKKSIVWSGRLMMAGIILFSGSLYALSLSGIDAMGIITPFGGICFLAAWALLAKAAWIDKQ